MSGPDDTNDIWQQFILVPNEDRRMIIDSYYDSKVYDKIIKEYPHYMFWLLDSKYSNLMHLWIQCNFDDMTTKLCWGCLSY